MSKYKSKSTEELQKRNRTNPNGPKQKKNIFQLAESIDKKIQYVEIENKNKIVFAENLISFLQEINPEELHKLQFDPERQNIDSLLTSLVKVITDLNYKIAYNSEVDHDDRLRICYEISNGEWLWCLFETESIKKIPTEELKIGFAHFLNHLSKFAYHSCLESEYTNTNDTPYEMEFEMLESDEQCYNDEGDYDEGIAQEIEEGAYYNLHELQKMKSDFDSYLVEQINTFLEYKPDNDFHKAFQDFLIEGLSIDFSIMHNFMPDSDVYNDGGMNFDQCITIYFDCGKGIEQDHFAYMNENANNGVSMPMGWYSVEDNIVKKETSEEETKQMFYNFSYLEKIYDNFLNKMEWNI